MDSNLWTLIIVAGIGFAVIGGLAMLSSNYTLGNIKSKTVGDGQHGTARWATESEIRKTFALVPFDVASWREGKNLPTEQGLVLDALYFHNGHNLAGFGFAVGLLGAGSPHLAADGHSAGAEDIVDRLSDDALLADEHIRIGRHGAGVDVFLRKRPCQAQRQDRHREEPEHLEPERRAEDRGDHGGKRAYREPYRHKPRYDAFDYQQNDHCDQPHGRHTKPAGIKQHTAPPIRRLDLRGRRLLLLLTLYLVRKFYARAIIRHMLNFV